MNKIKSIMIFVLFHVLLFAETVFGSPFLVCDPSMDINIKVYGINGLAASEVEGNVIVDPANASAVMIKHDLATLAAGTYTVKARWRYADVTTWSEYGIATTFTKPSIVAPVLSIEKDTVNAKTYLVTQQLSIAWLSTGDDIGYEITGIGTSTVAGTVEKVGTTARMKHDITSLAAGSYTFTVKMSYGVWGYSSASAPLVYTVTLPPTKPSALRLQK